MNNHNSSSPGNVPFVSIVILNYNGIDYLENCLESVYKTTDCTFEVLLIDNNSSDDSIFYVTKTFKDVKIISLDKNYGFAEAYNLGIKVVKEEHICLINNDILVTENWLHPIREKIKKNPLAIIQPTILDINNVEYFEYAGASGGYIDKYGYPYCRGRIFNTLEKDKGQYSDSKIFWASGACFFISKKVFYKIGGFDKRFFAHMEEIDLCWRAFNLGFECYSITSSKVFHVGAATIKRNSKKTYLNYRNSLIMLTKNLPLNNLLPTLFTRLILDIISSIKFLLEGNISYFIAIYKAHISYFYMIKIFSYYSFRRTCFFDFSNYSRLPNIIFFFKFFFKINCGVYFYNFFFNIFYW